MRHDVEDLSVIASGGDDSATEREALPRQSVDGPYRDRREGLLARRRRIAIELDAALRSAERAPHLARHLAALDAELGMASAPLLETPRDPAPGPLTRALRSITAGLIAGTSAGIIATSIMLPAVDEASRSAALRTLRERELVTALDAARAAPSPAPEPSTHPHLHPHPHPAIAIHSLRSSDRAGRSDIAAPLDALALETHIRWIAPQAWEIDRALIDRLMREPAPLGGARALRLGRDGEVGGVRLHGIRRSALLGRLGLHNGDIVLDVNGLDLAVPEAALTAYLRGATADAFFVRLVRDGEERMHVYRVAD